MPTLKENIAEWAENYDWSDEGEEWSGAWGSSSQQWYGSILPRIYSFLPCNTILEIAPGYGRWTKFLLPQCTNYIGVDISERCINACKSYFPEVKDNFFITDGKTFEVVEDDSVDFVFSFDSLVHADLDVMAENFKSCIKKMKHGGVAFIHHSNFFEFKDIVSNQHWRDDTVSAHLVAQILEKLNVSTVLQEKIAWGNDAHLIDTITIFRKGHVYEGCNVIESPQFMEESRISHKLFAHYHKQSQISGKTTVDSLHSYKQQVADMKDSLSWRITAPLRCVYSLFSR